MNSLTRGFSWIALHWRTSAVIACTAVGIAVTTRRYLETDEARVQREQRNRKKELRAVADKISTYGRKVHQRYPTTSRTARAMTAPKCTLLHRTERKITHFCTSAAMPPMPMDA
jgi:hypothetical protein